MDFKYASKILILALAGGSFALTASAQWQWIDKDGHKVFSDRAPSSDIPQKNILKQPGGKGAAALPGNETGIEPSSTEISLVKASAPKLSGKDAQLEARKKQTDEAEEAKKKAEDEKIAKAKTDNCERAKKAAATLQSGVRLSVTNAQGEREFMDDTAKATEAKRLQGILESDCKK